jgi:predicted permease
MVLFLFQVLPSFASSEPFVLLTTLPFQEKDFTLVTFLSFIRTFDSQVICAILVQVALIAYFTASLTATVLMLVASTVNVVFGIAIAVVLSRLFYKNMMRGGRSIAVSISRFLFIITWGIAIMGISFFFDFIPYLTNYIDRAVSSNLSHPLGLVFSLVHPFSAALVITSAVYPSMYGSNGVSYLEILSYAATIAYLGLGIFAARKTIGVVASVARGQGVNIVRKVTKEFGIKPRVPLFSYIIKDLRIASKTPSTAFLFAFPVIETVIIYFSISSVSRFSSTSVITAMSIGLFFIMFMSLSLLNTEASAIDLTLSLPLPPITIVNAKTVLAFLAYLPVPIVMLLLEFHKTLTTPYLVLLPFVELLGVAAASSAQLGLFIVGHRQVVVTDPAEGGRVKIKRVPIFQPSGFSLIMGRDVIKLAESIVIGIVLLASPIGVYGATYLLGHSHLMAVTAMLIESIAELGLVQFIIRR